MSYTDILLKQLNSGPSPQENDGKATSTGATFTPPPMPENQKNSRRVNNMDGMLSEEEIRALLNGLDEEDFKTADDTNETEGDPNDTVNESAEKADFTEDSNIGGNDMSKTGKKVVDAKKYAALISAYCNQYNVDIFDAEDAISERYEVAAEGEEQSTEEQNRGRQTRQNEQPDEETMEDILNSMDYDDETSDNTVEGDGDIPEPKEEATFQEFKEKFAYVMHQTVTTDDIEELMFNLSDPCMVNVLSGYNQRDWDNPWHWTGKQGNRTDTIEGARMVLVGTDYIKQVLANVDIEDWPKKDGHLIAYKPYYCESEECIKEVLAQIIDNYPDAEPTEISDILYEEVVYFFPNYEEALNNADLQRFYEEIKNPNTDDEEPPTEEIGGINDLFGNNGGPQQRRRWSEEPPQQRTPHQRQTQRRQREEDEYEDEQEGRERRPESKRRKKKEKKEKKGNSPAAIIAICVMATLLVVAALIIICIVNDKMNEKFGDSSDTEITQDDAAASDQQNANAQTPDVSVNATGNEQQTAAPASNIIDGATDSNEATADNATQANDTASSSNNMQYVTAEPNSVFDLPAECYGPLTGSNGIYTCETTISQEQAKAMLDELNARGVSSAILRYFSLPEDTGKLMAQHPVEKSDLEKIANGESTSFTIVFNEKMMRDDSVQFYTHDIEYFYVVQVLTKTEVEALLQKFYDDSSLKKVNVDPGKAIKVEGDYSVSNFEIGRDTLQKFYDSMVAVGAEKMSVQFRYKTASIPGHGA